MRQFRTVAVSGFLTGLTALSVTRATGQTTCPVQELPGVFSTSETVSMLGPLDRVTFEGAQIDANSNRISRSLPWRPSTADLQALNGLGSNAVAVFTSSTNSTFVCTTAFQVSMPTGTPSALPPTTAPGSPVATPTSTPANSPHAQLTQSQEQNWSVIPLQNGDCENAGRVLEARIRSEQAGSDYTALVFDEATGDVCYRSTDRSRFGSALHVAILTKNPILWERSKLTFSPCSLQESKLIIFVPENLPAGGALQSDQFYLRRFQSRRCYDPKVTITIETVPAGKSMTTELEQARRYHAALQVGVAFSNLHDHAFGITELRDTARIFDKGPVHNGPEYTATVLIYSVLNQIQSIMGGERYPGRDLVSDNGLLDRIGAVLGTGLNKPGDRFVAGLSYEAVPGVNAMLVGEFARVSRLQGISTGEQFKGTAEQIPVQRVWRRGLAFGVSIDLTYATKLLSR